MKGNLNLYELLVALLIVGKIGHIGTLGQLSIWEALIPAYLDVVHRIVFGYLKYSGVIAEGSWRIEKAYLNWKIGRKAKKVIEDIAKQSK